MQTSKYLLAVATAALFMGNVDIVEGVAELPGTEAGTSDASTNPQVYTIEGDKVTLHFDYSKRSAPDIMSPYKDCTFTCTFNKNSKEEVVDAIRKLCEEVGLFPLMDDPFDVLIKRAVLLCSSYEEKIELLQSMRDFKVETGVVMMQRFKGYVEKLLFELQLNH